MISMFMPRNLVTHLGYLQYLLVVQIKSLAITVRNNYHGVHLLALMTPSTVCLPSASMFRLLYELGGRLPTCSVERGYFFLPKIVLLLRTFLPCRLPTSSSRNSSKRRNSLNAGPTELRHAYRHFINSVILFHSTLLHI